MIFLIIMITEQMVLEVLMMTNKEETDVFQDLIWSLNKCMKDNQLIDATSFILKVVNEYPSILKMKIHDYLNFN